MAGGWRDVGSESVLIAGGGRAILLQLAHPAVGRGVAEHSDFDARVLGRLDGTLSYVYAVFYGTPAERAWVRRLVNRAHVPVRGVADRSGPAYNAYDPELQLWVAATLYQSTVTVYERVFGPLDERTADDLYREYSVVGSTLQLASDAWPTDRAAFARYWDETVEGLEVSSAARDVARRLLRPSTGPRWLRAAMPLASLVTAGLLPPHVRTQYGFAWNARLQRRFDRWFALTRFAYPRMPVQLRHGLRDHYLRRLRAQMRNSPQPLRGV
jgi:uncharacterized protein (DUF2236 family)